MTDSTACRSCGHAFSKGDRFCPKCGTEAEMSDVTSSSLDTAIIPPNPTECASCQSPMGPDDRFCPSCGTGRDEDRTVVSTTSVRNMQAKHLEESTRGEFEIMQQLGVGAMGSVYLARDIALSRRVAIKVIASNLLQDNAMVSRFRLEAQTVASLRHPNIVNVHAVRQADDVHFFVMDFIDGPPLRSIVKAHAPLEIPIVQALLYQVGSALDYAHHRGKGVIHRDIKPANIMVDREGDAFVTDFGISKITESQTGLTQTGATIGTPEYMSPEQCRGEALTGASDQYALGIVAYEMICGRTPFSGSQYFIMVAHTSETPTPISELRPDCPPHVAQAVHRMLAKNPGDRFPDLESAMSAMGGKPLGRRDPIRQRITALAGATAELAALDTASPLSPLPGHGSDDTATSVTVIGLPTSVKVGDSFQLSADVKGSTHTSIPGANVVWASSNPSVASVVAGRVQAISEGTAVITAEANGITGTVGVLVKGTGATLPTADAQAATIAVPHAAGQTGAAQSGGSKTGRRLATAAILLLLLSAGAWGAVQSGMVGGTIAGAEESEAGTVAEVEGPDGTDPVGATGAVASIAFAEAPDTIRIGTPVMLAARGLDASGNAASDGGPIGWSVDDEERARIEEDGTLVPLTAGPVTVTAEIAGVRESLTLLLAPEATEVAAADPTPSQPTTRPTSRPSQPAARVTSLAIDLPSTIVIGTSIDFAARVLDQRGNAMPNALERVRWRSDDPLVLRLGTGDFFDAVGPGTATVSARIGSITETIDITVAAPVERIALNRPALDLEVGDDGTLSARVFGPNDVPLPGSDVRWTSSNVNVATVDASGRVSAVGTGTATVAAASEGVAGRADITVRPRPIQPPTARDARAAANAWAGMLNEGDEAAITRAYDPSVNDKLDDLLDFVDNNDFQAALVEDEELGGVPLSFSFDGQEFATADFRLRFTFRTSFGGERVQLRDFRLVFARRGDGSGWRPVSAVMLDD